VCGNGDTGQFPTCQVVSDGRQVASFRLMCSTLRSDVVGEGYERTYKNVRISSSGNDGREKAEVTIGLFFAHVREFLGCHVNSGELQRAPQRVTDAAR